MLSGVEHEKSFITSGPGHFSWIEPVLKNEDKVSCRRTQHPTDGQIQTYSL